MTKTGMDVRTKDNENFGLLKIPDQVVIRQLRMELGKANSYIQELEHKILGLNKIDEKGKCSKCRKKDEQIKNLEKKNRDLIAKSESKDWEEKYIVLSRKYNAIEKELIRHATGL